MNIKILSPIGLYIMLCSIIAAVFRQQEILVYGIFSIGFFLAILPTDTRKIPLRGILAVAIPLIALQVPLPLPSTLPGLVRLGIHIGTWTIILLVIVVLSSMLPRKWTDNDTRQTSK